MSDTSTGTAVVKCKKGCGKVIVLVKDAVTNEPIAGATVLIRKKLVIGKRKAPIELTTDENGKAHGELKAGKYRLYGRAGGGHGQTPALPYTPTPKAEIQKIQVKKGVDNELEVPLTKVPRCKPTIALAWKDGSTGRPFPLDLNVDLVMAGDGSVVECKVGAGGVLVRRTGTDVLDFLQSRGPAKVRIPASTTARFVSCEKKGDPVADATLVAEGDLAGLGDKRFFELPKEAVDLGVGTWAVTADGGAYRTGNKDFVTTRDAIGSTGAPTTATFEPDWPCRPFLTLQWKDPEGTARPFPVDLHVDLLLTTPTDSKVEAKVGADGLLVARTGTAPLFFGQSRGPVKVKVAAGAEERYVAVEGRGVTPAAAPALVLASALGTLGVKRAFLLPKAAFGLELGRWTVADHETTYEEAEKRFTTADKASIGTSAKSAKVVLAPVWQFVRLTYQDRFAGGDDQVSVLPVFLEGYAGATYVATDLKARSNWTHGASAEAAIQCLPWVLLGDDTKPDKDNLLRFTTEADTFIETEDSTATPKPRKLVVGPQATPTADRLRFYDLPAEWRSTNWFVRTSARTLDKAGGKFFFELDTAAKAQATKEAPLVMSLDDIVLYKDANDPYAVLGASVPVAVFKNTFGKGTPADANVSDLGLFRSTTSIASTVAAADAYYPCSEDRVLIRGGSTGYTAIIENYIVEYPSWTRLVVAAATLFDCFADRTKKKDGEVRVVGARAAVQWVDPVAPMNGLSGGGATGTNDAPLPGRYFGTRLSPVRRTFGAAQLQVAVETPLTNSRRDAPTSGGKGTAFPGTVTDLPGLTTTRVARAVDRAKEWQTPLASGGVIGRWDLVLLRCCGRKPDGTNPATEQAVLLQHFRTSFVFAPGPNPPASTKTTDDLKRAFMTPAIDALHTRWNGPDSTWNPGRARISPIDPTKDPGKLEVDVLRFHQCVPDARAAIRATVVANVDGARDFMDSGGGLTQTQEQNVLPQTTGDVGWFTAAHEMGHGGGLLDDYCELWNHCSYNQPGVVPLVPGDPYMLDDTDGRESMMKANKIVRPRNFWHLAEWVHAVLAGDPLQVKHGTSTYKLPHHASTSFGNLPRIRSYLSFCYDSILDAPVTIATVAKPARCDLYLYALGSDAYSEDVLTGRANSSIAFDGIIVVMVHLGVKVHGVVDHDQLSAYASKITSTLRARFGYRCCADVTVGTRRFERALIHISPRVLISTAAQPANSAYLDQIEAKPRLAWTARQRTPEGVVITDGTRCYKSSDITYAGGGGRAYSTGGTQPVWPVSGSVNDGGVRWTYCGVDADKDRLAHEGATERRARENQLHAILELGTPATELVETPGELPRLKVQINDMTNLRTAVSTLLRAVATARANLKSDRDGLHAPPTTPKTYDTEITAAKQARDAKKLERDGIGPAPRIEAKQLEWVTKDNELTALQATLDGWERAKALDADFRLLHGPLQVAIAGRTQAMLDGLFLDASTPLTDATYTTLTQQPGLAATASTQPKATRATVAAAVAGTPAQVAAVRAAVSDLTATSRPADASAVVAAIVGVATAVRTYADAGTTPAQKKAMAEQARAAIRAMVGTLEPRRQWRITGNPTMSAFDLDSYLVTNHDLELGMDPSKKASQAATIEERLEEQFAAYLGLTVARTADGYLAFAAPFADASTTPAVYTCAPPDAPPPPTTPPSTSPVITL